MTFTITDITPERLAVTERLGSGKRASDAFTTFGNEVFARVWSELSDLEKSRMNEAAEVLSARAVRLLTVLDAEFPESLKEIPSCPSYLFASGNLGLLSGPAVGFCGSRNASERGLIATSRCCKRAAQTGIVVVSGHARGVDAIAHRTALESGGSTIIVPAEGIMAFRLRRELRGLVTDENALVLSPFALEEKWAVGRAMARNGTIVGLSDALVAVEPGKTGGTADAIKKSLTMHKPTGVIRFDELPEATFGSSIEPVETVTDFDRLVGQ